MKNEWQSHQAGSLFLNWLWLVPAAIIIVSSLFSYANVDSTRDFIEAYRIASGQNLPLLGPQMAFSFSVGPWWFYLLSLVLLVFDSWLAISLLTAVLTAFKYFLAYRVGCLVAGKSLGLLMVSCLLMVSLTWMQSIFFTHTSLVETVVLLVVFLTLKDQQNKATTWFVLGLLCGLAFHVHPTAFLAGYFVLVKWFGETRKLRNSAWYVVGLLLMFSPVLVHELGVDKSTVQGAVNYLQQQTNTVQLIDYFKLFFGLWVVAPFALLKSLMSESSAIFLMVVQLFIQLIAFIAPFIYREQMDQVLKRLLMHLWLFLLLCCLGLLLIRVNTPWYMTYGVSMISALITAIGLYVICQCSVFKKAVWLCGGWLFLTFIGAQWLIIKNLNNNQVVVPSASLHDIKSLNADLSGFGYEITAHQAVNHGQFTCKNKPVSLHGPYSNLIYAHSGMEHMSQCSDGLFYGPKDNVNHWLGVPPQFEKHIKSQAKYQVGNSYFYQPIDMSTNQLAWQEDFKHDYERSLQTNADWQKDTVQVKLFGGNHLSITNLVGFKMQLKIVSVQVDGTEVNPVAKHVYASLFTCDTCSSEDTAWVVEYQEGVTGMTNVVSF